MSLLRELIKAGYSVRHKTRYRSEYPNSRCAFSKEIWVERFDEPGYSCDRDTEIFEEYCKNIEEF